MLPRERDTYNADFNAEPISSSKEQKQLLDDTQSRSGDARKGEQGAKPALQQRNSLLWTVCAVLAVLLAIYIVAFQPELATLRAISEPLLAKECRQKASSEGRRFAATTFNCH